MFTSCCIFLTILTIFNTINTFMTVRLIKQSTYLTSLDIVFNDADVKSYYDLSNSERQ